MNFNNSNLNDLFGFDSYDPLLILHVQDAVQGGLFGPPFHGDDDSKNNESLCSPHSSNVSSLDTSLNENSNEHKTLFELNTSQSGQEHDAIMYQRASLQVNGTYIPLEDFVRIAANPDEPAANPDEPSANPDESFLLSNETLPDDDDEAKFSCDNPCENMQNNQAWSTDPIDDIQQLTPEKKPRGRKPLSASSFSSPTPSDASSLVMKSTKKSAVKGYKKKHKNAHTAVIVNKPASASSCLSPKRFGPPIPIVPPTGAAVVMTLQSFFASCNRT